MSEINYHINTEEKDGWDIIDDQGAEWALKKIAEAKAEAETWREFYEHKMVEAATKAANTIDFMSAKLRRYFESVPHHTTKTQESYELPSGKLILKAQQPDYVRDEKKLSEWALESGHSQYVKTVTKESFDWAAMKKDLKDYMITEDGLVMDPMTGEFVEGLEVKTREPKFVIE